MAKQKKKKKQKITPARLSGENFKKLRDEMGISRIQLGKLTGLSELEIWRIEHSYEGRKVTRVQEHILKTLLFIHLSGQMKIFQRWKYKRFVYVQPWSIYWWKRRRG